MFENNVNVIESYSIIEISELPFLLPFENGISRVLYTPVQQVNHQVQDFHMGDGGEDDVVHGVDLMDGGNMSDVTYVTVGSDEEFDKF